MSSSSLTSKRISFLVPIYNEEKTLLQTINHITQSAQQHLTEYEIILVNDGSTDKSEESISDQLSRNDIRYHAFSVNKGFGAAYVQALNMAKLSHVMYLCADGDVTHEELSFLLQTWDGKSALLQYCENLHKRNFSRWLLSKLYTKLVQTLSRTQFPYYNGFNILPRASLIDSQIHDYGFSTQAYILLQATTSATPIQLIGTVCRFNDVNSKALTFKNFLNALYFFLYMIRTKWITLSSNQH